MNALAAWVAADFDYIIPYMPNFFICVRILIFSELYLGSMVGMVYLHCRL